MDWASVAREYLAENPESSPAIRDVAAQISSGVSELSRALDPEVARAVKSESTGFLLYAIGAALDDHVLSLEGANDLRTLQRVFRIDEGDLLRHQRATVADLLCREAAQMFEDQGLSRAEEQTKTRLQEVLGLSYDEFIGLLEPAIDELLQAFYRRMREGTRETWLGTDALEIRDRLKALSLTQYVQWLRQGDRSRVGYIYLLVNPSMPGLVKVGRTSQPPSMRADELTRATGVPTPFQVVFELLVTDRLEAEAYVHRVLEDRGARVSANREFFAVEPDEAVQVMLEARERT